MHGRSNKKQTRKHYAIPTKGDAERSNDILKCWRCGTRFLTVAGIKIAHGMILQETPCPTCGTRLRSLRHLTEKHKICFVLALGILHSDASTSPCRVADGVVVLEQPGNAADFSANDRGSGIDHRSKCGGKSNAANSVGK